MVDIYPIRLVYGREADRIRDCEDVLFPWPDIPEVGDVIHFDNRVMKVQVVEHDVDHQCFRVYALVSESSNIDNFNPDMAVVWHRHDNYS